MSRLQARRATSTGPRFRPAKPPSRRLRPRPSPRSRPRAWPWPRLAAALMVVLLVVGLGWLSLGPWLRVSEVSWQGAAWTPADRLARAVARVRGVSLLLVDPGALAATLAEMPAVERAEVELALPNRIEVRLVESGPLIVWQTLAVRLLVAADGAVVGEVALGARMSPELAALPLIDDRRPASRDVVVGDLISLQEVATALVLADVPPGRYGASTPQLEVSLDPLYGFVVSSTHPSWRAAFGFYGLDPTQTASEIKARIDQQVAAVRTLFETRPESSVSWIDARNPGKVYFRAGG